MGKRATRVKPAPQPYPAPNVVKIDSRICFSIAFYASEDDANRAHEIGRQRGDTYNGGYFHGMACGRDKRWDHVDKDTGRQLYAVTF